MTRETLLAILNAAGVKESSAKYEVPEGLELTFHVSLAGSTMSVAEVRAVHLEKGFVRAEVADRRVFAFEDASIVAVTSRPPRGSESRRPGFA